jgi:hypothetical protein
LLGNGRDFGLKHLNYTCPEGEGSIAEALGVAELFAAGEPISSSFNCGSFQFPEKFLPLMIADAMDDNTLPIHGDGKQQRDWLHVGDNCRGVLAVLERSRVGEVYDLGGVDIEENLTIFKVE